MAKVEVTMPKMGESITEGTVIVWHKQPGDMVELDETLLEIGTDKVDTEVPSPAAGVLQEILVPEGETVDVNTAIAIIETEAEAGGSAEPAETPSNEGAAEVDSEEAAPEAADLETPEEFNLDAESESESNDHPESSPASVSPGGGATTEVVMPKMGESITEGTVIVWHKQPGDMVELDETLLEIGTDKVDTEVPSPAAGVLQEILVQEGETVEVGTAIALIATEAGASTAATPSPFTPKPAAQPSGNGEQMPTEATKTQPQKPAPAQPSGDGAVMEPQTQDASSVGRHTDDGRFISPLVRSIAETEGLSMDELAQISGSGREGRVTKKDVMNYLANRSVQPQPAKPTQPKQPAPVRPAPSKPASRPMSQPVRQDTEEGERVEIVEMDRMRQIIADHMVRSKATSAHVTSFAEVDVTNLVKLREASKQAFLEREGIKLTYTPFFVHAAVEALTEHPILNASVEGKRIVVKKNYHIGIAVAIEKAGLIVPVIRNAGRQNIVGLAHSASDLAQRARSKQLQPDDLQGGTFTVTNVGSLGSIMGTPIISQPQVAILATGAIKKRPVVLEDPNLGDVIAIRHMMYLSLSYDHRIIDGSMGVSFLRKFAQVIESIDPDMEI